MKKISKIAADMAIKISEGDQKPSGKIDTSIDEKAKKLAEQKVKLNSAAFGLKYYYYSYDYGFYYYYYYNET